MKYTPSPPPLGDDLMVNANAPEKESGQAVIILAWCRGIRHILTPIAWVGVAAFGYLSLSLIIQ